MFLIGGKSRTDFKLVFVLAKALLFFFSRLVVVAPHCKGLRDAITLNEIATIHSISLDFKSLSTGYND